MTAPRRDEGSAIAHVPALDGLRGVAILLVIGMHFGVRAGFPGIDGSAPGRLLERVFYVGWAGVDLFFVLSGYLITRILVATREDPHYYRTFYGRRALRIFPLHYVALFAGLVVLPLVAPGWLGVLGESRAHQAWLWTYTSNLALAFGVVRSLGVFDLFWTLAIEEQFYLVWPLVVRIASPRALRATAVALIALALALRVVWVVELGDWSAAYRFTLTRADALAMGALVATLVVDPAWRPRLERLARLVLVGAGGVLALLVLTLDPFYPSQIEVSTIGHTLVGLVAAAVVALVEVSPSGRSARLLAARWLRAWGRVSYGVYVWHWPLWMALDLGFRRIAPAHGTGPALAQAGAFLLVGLAGSFLLGLASSHGLERWFLRFKGRVAYLPGTSAGGPPP